MKNCVTCFHGNEEECPIFTKRFEEKECFGWVKNQAAWDKRLEAVDGYKCIMEVRGIAKKKEQRKTKREKVKQIKEALRKEK